MTALDARPAEHGPHGPYASLDAAAEDAAHVYAAVRQLGDTGLLPRILEGLELATLRECGVEVGPGDMQFAAWLASWEPMFVQIVDGWVERSYAAGHGVLLAEIVRLRAVLGDVGLTMVRCCGAECVTTAALPVGSSFLCSSHGDCGNGIKEGDGS